MAEKKTTKRTTTTKVPKVGKSLLERPKVKTVTEDFSPISFLKMDR